MGVESFFINVEYIQNILKNEKKCFFEFLSVLKDKGFAIKYDNKKKKYIINNILYMDILEDEFSFKGFSLEGCFSCFEEASSCMADLLVLIDEKIQALKITNNNSIFENLTDKNLIQKFIQDYFKYQKEAFDKNYFFKIKTLPGKEFYRKNTFYSIINVFKS